MNFFRANNIKTVNDFLRVANEVAAQEEYAEPAAFAMGIGFKIGDDIVAAQYPLVNIRENHGTAALLSDAVGRVKDIGTWELSSISTREAIKVAFSVFDGDGNKHSNIDVFTALNNTCKELSVDVEPLPLSAAEAVPIVTFIGDLESEAVDAADVYLRLHLLSHRKVTPNSINLGGIFGKLETLAWTNFGVFRPGDIATAQIECSLYLGAPMMVYCLDKFPPMLSMVVPEGVRIADGNRVRLGAYLAEGTTVMHEGACNFNAGTLGAGMVEGRISAGVVSGRGSAIGGGASTMGTLSGGNDVKISIGEDCLLEAESGLGIPIGNRVRVEVGAYIKSTTPVRINRFDWDNNPIAKDAVRGKSGKGIPETIFVKAVQLSGISDAIFRRNAKDGAIEVIPRGNSIWGELNADLHKN